MIEVEVAEIRSKTADDLHENKPGVWKGKGSHRKSSRIGCIPTPAVLGHFLSFATCNSHFDTPLSNGRVDDICKKCYKMLPTS